jgi:hypothetical protein
MAQTTWQKRVGSGDWDAITAEVNDFGGALLPQLLTPAEATQIRRLYPDDHLFRATIDMRRYRFGEGEYRYFKQPYPEPIEHLKQALNPHGIGGQSCTATHRGPTRSTTGWTAATRPARPSRPPSCSNTVRATGTHCIGTCTGTWCFHCRW